MSFQMPVFVDWLITIIVSTLFAAYVWYIVSLRRQPAGQRPRTPVYNRFGQRVGTEENPDYQVIPAEEEDEPD